MFSVNPFPPCSPQGVGGIRPKTLCGRISPRFVADGGRFPPKDVADPPRRVAEGWGVIKKTPPTFSLGICPPPQGGRRNRETDTRRSAKQQQLIATSLVFVIMFACVAPAWAIVEDGLRNVLGNPGFEQPLGSNVGDVLGDGIFRPNWDNTPGRGIFRGTSAGNSGPVTPRSGSNVLLLDEAGLAAASNIFTFQSFKISDVGDGVFVSFSAYALLAEVDGGAANDGARLKIEFKNAQGTLLSQFNTGSQIENAVTDPDVFRLYTVSATAPAGTREVVFTLEINDPEGGGATTVAFDDAVGTISRYPIVIDTSASKPRVTKGGATFISSRIKNVSAETRSNLELVATIPEGFTFIDSASRLDGVAVNSREGSRIFSIGSINSGENRKLGFLLAASSGLEVGKRYEVSFFVRETTGTVRSATKRIILTVVADPVFDEGITVGKVYDDQNENAVQDEGEHGIPGVKLATEEGIVVVTDPYGRYHIPAVKPGRHVVKIDGHTLPQATKFITEESVLVKNTEGMLNVVNFAVKLPEPQIPRQYRDQLNVLITQGVDLAKPELSIKLEPDVLRMGIGFFEKDPVFKVRTNYADLVSGWRMEIRDQFGDEVWTGYGLGPPPIEAPWNGQTTQQEAVESGTYSYRLIVRDSEGREDWTPLQYFRVVSKLDSHAADEPKIDVPSVGNMSIDRDGKRSIPMVAKPKVLVRGKTVPWNTVAVNGESIGVNLDGTFQTEFYAPPGNQSIIVTTTDPEGNSLSHQEEVALKESYFFMVGLGEEELGANFGRGNLEVVGRDDRFEHGFYEDGRLAFYLKGKIKGKFLVTGRYDTDDPRRELFTNLDPDLYYPVYGDDSEISYDAYDTKQRFYVLAEMDRSFAKWGSFHTDFRDTELSTHSRTFSGLKLHYETLSTTRYGDAKRGFAVYSADVDQLADHNEFLGAGGSRYYLRNKNVIEGSEKVRLELRDKIQGMTIASRDLIYGTDYEIDYDGGRIILTTPLFSTAGFSDWTVSDDIRSGGENYLIVDYEFDPQGSTEDRNNGIRGFMHLGDHLRVGGTAVEDRRPGGDYDLRGVDLVGKFGRNTKVVAEYARTERRTIRNAISFDSGITFTDVQTGNTWIKKANRLFDDAYLIKAQTKLKTDTEVSGYVEEVHPGFSNADLIRQAGTRKTGVEVNQSAGEHVELRYRYDTQKSTDPENRSTVFVTSPEEGRIHSAQLKAEYDHYLVTTEYRNQNVDIYPASTRSLTTALDDVQFKNAVGVKAGYRVTEDIMPYVRAQVASGAANQQFGGGVQAKVMDGKGTVQLEQMVGNVGDSTKLSFDVPTSETNKAYATLSSGPSVEGRDRVMNTTIGSSTQVNSKSRFYSERDYSSYRKGEREASILGYDRKLSDRWRVGGSFERSYLRDITAVNSHRNSAAAEVSYLDRDVLKLISRYEFRYDQGVEDRIHWLFRDTLDWKISDVVRFSARFNRSDTNRFTDWSFRTDAAFTELNVGLAYRPILDNQFNILTRYTWLTEKGAQSQFNTPDIFGIEVDESAHLFALEFGYAALPPYVDLVEKLAYRRTSLEAEGDAFYIGNFLWVNRFNFHVIRKWDFVFEYRMLWGFELLEDLKQGVLLELDREILDYVRLGVGYNFTHFDDDLRFVNDYSRHGFFTRLSGKF
ncbi:MAG: hypothetical protein A3G87_02305 [Omnitrophica bacterium RIFCSPLOWO2_12_FULL_50_11]|nr:MAG: hypothetical protein A3G87_02305 [Omnitrophica bacterium RIFCSPLOWO2_12_FULL_50_11]